MKKTIIRWIPHDWILMASYKMGKKLEDTERHPCADSLSHHVIPCVYLELLTVVRLPLIVDS
jgi:hypothetical protein